MSVSQVINVIVNSKGAVTVKKQLSEIGDSARTTTTYLNGLRSILSAALTFSGASSIIEMANSFTALQNRLRQVTSESDSVTESWNRLLNIANSSYSTIDSTVDLYFRVAQAYKAWGESAEKAFEFTELFQKAAILSGSTMQTTSQAVYQFSQALNKGKLDGDEFRSVLEGLPYVATLIQKSLGVTRKELYAMSKDGEISVDRIKQAFEEAAGSIQKDWKNITPTIGMALTVLKNNWTDFIGDIQNSTGVFTVIAKLIILVADNFKLLAIAMTPVALALAVMAGRLGLGLVVTGFKDMYSIVQALIPLVTAFNAVMWANPYLIVAAAIIAVVAAVVYFRNELGLTNEVLGIIWSTAVSVFTFILTTLNPIGLLLNTIVTQFTTWKDVFNAIGAIAKTVGQAIINMAKSIVKVVKDLAAYISKSLAPVFSELANLAKNFFGLIMDIVDLIKDQFVSAIKEVGTTFKPVWDYIKPSLEVMIKLLGDIWEGWKIIASYLKGAFSGIIKDVFEGWIIIIRKVIQFVNDLISSLKAAIALMKAAGGGGGGGGGGAKGAHYGAQFYAGEFASGGQFKVGGTNSGRDTTPVAFRAERGERVTVETKKQQRYSENGMTAANVNVPVSIINVQDPNMVPMANMTERGQRSIVNAIIANRDEINAELGVR